jgi:hypothetical protein
MLRDKAPIELEEEVEDRDANEDGRGNEELHRIALLAPIVALRAGWRWMARWRHRGTDARCGKAIRRDLWHLRLVTLITGP